MANKLRVASNLLKIVFGLGFGLLVVLAVIQLDQGSSGRLLQETQEESAQSVSDTTLSDNFIIFRLINLGLIALMGITTIKCYRDLLSRRAPVQQEMHQCTCSVHTHQSMPLTQPVNPLP